MFCFAESDNKNYYQRRIARNKERPEILQRHLYEYTEILQIVTGDNKRGKSGQIHTHIHMKIHIQKKQNKNKKNVLKNTRKRQNELGRGKTKRLKGGQKRRGRGGLT